MKKLRCVDTAEAQATSRTHAGRDTPRTLAPIVTTRPTAVELAFGRIAKRIHPTVPTVPGGYNMALLVAARRSGLELLVTCSEFGASWIGSAIAWETGLPTLVIVITSPGVYGTIQALHAAFVNRAPLILVSGEASLPGSVQSGGGFDGPSVTRLTSSLTAWSTDVMQSDLVGPAFERAVAVAATARRPVHLNIPVHVGAQEVSS